MDGKSSYRFLNSGSYPNQHLTAVWSSMRAVMDSSGKMVIQSESGYHSTRLQLSGVHNGTQNSGLSSSVARTKRTSPFITKFCWNDHTHGLSASGIVADLVQNCRRFCQLFGRSAWTFLGSSVHSHREPWGPISWHIVNVVWDKLVGCVDQVWIVARLLFPGQSCWGTRLSVPAPRTTSQGVEKSPSPLPWLWRLLRRLNRSTSCAVSQLLKDLWHSVGGCSLWWFSHAWCQWMVFGGLY